MATPSLTYLPLDSNGDIIISNGNMLTGVYAVAQAVLTRLRLWYGEWWEDLSLGLPVFQQILGQPATRQGLAAMQQAVQSVIEGTPYVTSCTVASATFQDGALNFQATIQTAFGPVTITQLPGQQAIVD